MRQIKNCTEFVLGINWTTGGVTWCLAAYGDQDHLAKLVGRGTWGLDGGLVEAVLNVRARASEAAARALESGQVVAYPGLNPQIGVTAIEGWVADAACTETDRDFCRRPTSDDRLLPGELAVLAEFLGSEPALLGDPACQAAFRHAVRALVRKGVFEIYPAPRYQGSEVELVLARQKLQTAANL